MQSKVLIELTYAPEHLVMDASSWCGFETSLWLTYFLGSCLNSMTLLSLPVERRYKILTLLEWFKYSIIHSILPRDVPWCILVLVIFVVIFGKVREKEKKYKVLRVFRKGVRENSEHNGVWKTKGAGRKGCWKWCWTVITVKFYRILEHRNIKVNHKWEHQPLKSPFQKDSEMLSEDSAMSCCILSG